jgi:hypothetical protein
MHSSRPISTRFSSALKAIVVSLFCALAFSFCAADAQTSAPPSPLTSLPQTAPPARSAAPAATPAANVEPAPAKVTMASGKLTVTAQNSDLTAILQQISRASGMTIDGLGKTSRIFGVYGPGSPRDVLTDLLDGSGYNFEMLGGTNGSAPRKLVLTEKTAGPVPSPRATPVSLDADDADSDDADQQTLGAGAIPHPSPQFTDNTDPETRAQQNLQRLQQMRQEMVQQQQQNNPQ